MVLLFSRTNMLENHQPMVKDTVLIQTHVSARIDTTTSNLLLL